MVARRVALLRCCCILAALVLARAMHHFRRCVLHCANHVLALAAVLIAAKVMHRFRHCVLYLVNGVLALAIARGWHSSYCLALFAWLRRRGPLRVRGWRIWPLAQRDTALSGVLKKKSWARIFNASI